MITLLFKITFVAALILWSLIIGVFVVVKTKNIIQRKKYSNVPVPSDHQEEKTISNKGL